MNHKLPKIVFFGTEDYNSLVTLKALVEAGVQISAVVTKPDTARGRGQKLTQPPVKIYALEHGIEIWQPLKLRDITDNIKKLQPVVGILVAYGKIISQSTIDLFTPGIINIHPSLLPLWRGPSPTEAAIANQDSKTGVTIMQLEAGMDSGPIYSQTELQLSGTETKLELYNKLFNLGSQMLIDQLEDIVTGKLKPKAQDHEKATYCSMLSKDDSLIDPAKLSAAQADARVRAHLGFPRSRITFGDHTLIVTKTHVSKEQKSPLDIKCSDDNYLVIDELIAPSGKTMTAEAFLLGYAAKV